MENTNKSLLVIGDNNVLKGILTQRDLIHFHSVGHNESPIEHYMTKIENMITIQRDSLTSLEIHDLKKILTSHKIQKLPILVGVELYGLITLKDILQN